SPAAPAPREQPVPDATVAPVRRRSPTGGPDRAGSAPGARGRAGPPGRRDAQVEVPEPELPVRVRPGARAGRCRPELPAVRDAVHPRLADPAGSARVSPDPPLPGSGDRIRADRP